MHFKPEIETYNAGMASAEDVAVALEQAARKLRRGDGRGRVMDVNGNGVGNWSITLPEPEED